MSTIRGRRFAGLALTLVLIPTVALAEISAVTDHQGHFRRLFILTRGVGPSKVIWGQVRPAIPLHLILNPLGDNLGDLAPTIQLNPVTKLPWVFWSMNVANQKRIGFSFWNNVAWTPPALIVADPGPSFYDQLDPAVAFGADGTPYLVWWAAEQVGKVYFSTLVRGTWTPPLLLTDPEVDSRKPTIVLKGTEAVVVSSTPSGPVTKIFNTAVLFESASSLMDTPIPPGHTDDGITGGGGLHKR